MDGKPLCEILDTFERDVILQMLESVNWESDRGGRAVRIAPLTLNSKVKRLGIDAKRRRCDSSPRQFSLCRRPAIPASPSAHETPEFPDPVERACIADRPDPEPVDRARDGCASRRR